MLLELKDGLEDWASAIAEHLMPEKSLRRLLLLLDCFPPFRRHWLEVCNLGLMGLEMRLHGGEDQVDFFVPLSRNDGDRIVAAAHDDVAEGWLRADQHWQRLLQLFMWWITTDRILGRSRLVWMEFDVDDSSPDRLPIPNVFVQVMEGPAAPPAMTERRRQVLYLRSVASILFGREPTEAFLEKIDQCLACLPRGAFVKFAGLMLDRDNGVRLCIDGVRYDAWASYLNALKGGPWCGI